MLKALQMRLHHIHESVHIKAPSTPQEKLSSMEEAQSCVPIVSVVDTALGSAHMEWPHFRIPAHPCHR